MPNPALALAGVSAGTGLIGARAQKKAAASASSAQVQSAQLGIDEQRRQFDSIQELLAPFVSGGTDAMGLMASFANINGPEAQQAAIDNVSESPIFADQVRAAEEAMLQNASATGGLRGGNTQAALAQMRPAMLSQAIDQRYQMLGGLAGMGQASAAQQAQMGQNMANNVTDLYGQQGAARAGSALASGAATQNALGGIAGGFGNLMSYTSPMPEGASIFGKWGF